MRKVKKLLKQKIKRMIYGERADSDSYIKYLRKCGVKIGERVLIVNPLKISFDLTRPYLIEIGDDVVIAENVTILSHGFDGFIFQRKFGDLIGSAGKVKIGSNVFIGSGSTILKGVTIGDNVIVGSNSLVNKDIAPDSVAAGSPAHQIYDIETYYKKRKAAQLNEAKEIALSYYNVFKKIPPKECFHEFFWLFEKRNGELDSKLFLHMLGNIGFEKFMESEPIFNGYDEFLKWTGIPINS